MGEIYREFEADLVDMEKNRAVIRAAFDRTP